MFRTGKTRVTRDARVGLLVIALVALALSCGVPGQLLALIQTPTPTATSTPTPTNTPTATFTPPPTNTRVIPTSSSTLPASAILTLGDLPPGFQALSAPEMQQLHLTEVDLARYFGAVSTQAKPQNLAAFLTSSNPQKMQIVVGLTIYPMTALEKVALDLQMSNPEGALQAFGTGFSATSGGAKLSTLPGMSSFGDRSAGFTTTLASGGVALRMDMVVVSRGQAIEMLISMYPNGTTPPADIASLAKILDSRIAAAQGIK